MNAQNDNVKCDSRCTLLSELSHTKRRYRGYWGLFLLLHGSKNQVRISVYVQTLFCIVLCLFREADDLVNGAFRNAVLFLYAIAFAVVLSPDRPDGKISLQTYIVLHSTISILLLSSFALMTYYPSLRPQKFDRKKSWRQGWSTTSGLRKAFALMGALPLALWVWISLLQAINGDSRCAQFSSIKRTDTKNFPYYVGYWAGSISSYVFTLPLFGILWIWTSWNRGFWRFLPLLFWLVSWILMVVACEVAIKTVAYIGPDNQLQDNPAGSWAFGQVIPVVMLFSQFWDIVFYPLGQSRHKYAETGIPYRRYRWWYEKHFQKVGKEDVKNFFCIFLGFVVLLIVALRDPEKKAPAKDEEAVPVGDGEQTVEQSVSIETKTG